jgi:hypothetical protein
MSYTLLQLVDQVSGELGLTQPAAVIGSSNNQTIQLLALAQRLGKDLVRDYEWQRLVQAYIWQTQNAVSTTGNITANSKVITNIPSTAALQVGNVVTGTGQTPYAEILTIDSSTQVTLNAPVATSTSAVSMTFAKQDYDLPGGYDRMISDTNGTEQIIGATLGQSHHKIGSSCKAALSLLAHASAFGYTTTNSGFSKP